GLYWMHRRPENRLGLMLVVLGLIGVLYILESSSDPTLFRLGVVTEDPLFLLTAIVILAFPSGRLDGLPGRATMGLVVGMLTVTTALYASHLAPGFTIANCRHVCPGDPASTSAYSPDSWLVRQHVLGVLPIVIGLSMASVIVWRFVTGTPPRRRAL